MRRIKENDVCVVDALRLPFLRNGKLWKDMPVEKLGGIILQNLAYRYPMLSPNEVLMGCNVGIRENDPVAPLPVVPHQNPAKEACIKAKLQASGTTLNKVCSSSLFAILDGFAFIKSGVCGVVMAGGMENLLSLSREMRDAILSNPTIDPPYTKPYEEKTWNVGEWCATKYAKPAITRSELDSYAVESYRKAINAQEKGWFKNETVPLVSRSREFVVSDEEPPFREANYEDYIRDAKPMNGCTVITDANASKNAAGAGALLLASGKLVREFNVLARVAGVGTKAHEFNREFAIAPIGAIKKCCWHANVPLEKVDVVLINEAFASIPMIAERELAIPNEKLNPWGGAISLGHPIAGTGAMLSAMAIHGFIREKKRYALVVTCNALGEAVAVMYENMQL
jgi:acetyl-CoA C-acetyltransferase